MPALRGVTTAPNGVTLVVPRRNEFAHVVKTGRTLHPVLSAPVLAVTMGGLHVGIAKNEER